MLCEVRGRVGLIEQYLKEIAIKALFINIEKYDRCEPGHIDNNLLIRNQNSYEKQYENEVLEKAKRKDRD